MAGKGEAIMDERAVAKTGWANVAQVNVGGPERWFSAVAGAGLILRGLAKPSMGNALLGLLGVALVHRAATGHCAAYEALGVDTSEDSGRGKRGERSLRDEIESASEQSFPASDPPSWTPSSIGGPARHH
jgi:hypothetical protein